MKLRCTWVPNTLDRVHVTNDQHRTVLSLKDVIDLLGTAVMHDLYLKGRADVELSEPLAWPLVRARTALPIGA